MFESSWARQFLRAALLFMLVSTAQARQGIPDSTAVLQGISDSTAAQRVSTGSDFAWRPVLKADGIRLDYIFYSDNGPADNGVVLKISNDTDHDVRYRFTLILRNPDEEHVEDVTGVVGAGTLITGDREGLYFAPFGPEGSIGEIGLRGYRFEPLEK
jgi:hypothetical protein